jgi:hypothetical protein
MSSANKNLANKNVAEDAVSYISFGSKMDDSNPRLVFLKAINKRKYW